MKLFVLNRRIYITVLSVLVIYFPMITWSQDFQTRDFLKGRWYETEIIVFEYLSTISANEPETLAINTPRVWPKIIRSNSNQLTKIQSGNSFSFDQTSFQHNIENQIISSLVSADKKCLGYPNLVKKDSLHPAFIHAGITSEKVDQYLTRAKKESLELQEHESAILDLEPSSPPFEEEKSIIPSTENEFTLRTSTILDYVSEIGAFEAALHQSAFSWLPKKTFNLQNEYLAIRRAAGIRPVFHGRWRQSVPERGNAKPILISLNGLDSPKTLEKQLSKIEGLVHLTARKFLHLDFKLWYHADGLGKDPVSMPNRQLRHTGEEEYMELKETRRMRSDELHYFDHPKIGLIANIYEVKIPQNLSDSRAALLNSRTEQSLR